MNTLNSQKIKTEAVKSIKWEILNRVISKAGRPLVKLALIRILLPADFGVLAAAMIVINLAQMIQSFGLERALIRAPEEVDKSANIVFWTNLFFSIFLYLMILVNLPLFSKFFHEPIITIVLKFLSLQLIIDSFAIVHQALLQRNFHFKDIFFVKISSFIILSAVTIIMALLQCGLWSLIYGSLSGNLTEALLFWGKSSWRPKLAFDFKLAKQLFSFGKLVVSTTLLCWIILNIDVLIIGHFFGMRMLGIYHTGTVLIIVIFDMIFSPITTVAYPVFSRLRSNPEELKNLLLKIAGISALITLPIATGILVLAKPISSLIFGFNWQGIDMVISFSTVTFALFVLVVANGCAYEALGRPGINVKLCLLDVICFTLAYILAAPHGLFIFCLTRLILFIFDTGLRVAVANRVLGLSAASLLKSIKGPVIGSLIAGILAYSCVYRNNGLSGVDECFKIVITLGIILITYVLFLWLSEKELIKQTSDIFRKAVKL